MNAPKPNLRYFVKRADTIQEFRKLIEHPGPVLVGDMEGPFGVGKTTVMAFLYLSVKGSNVHQAWVDLDKYELQPPQPPVDPNREIEWLEHALELYRRLLVELGGALGLSCTRLESKFDQVDKSFLRGLVKTMEIEIGAGPVKFGVKPGDLAKSSESVSARRRACDKNRQGITQVFADAVNKLAKTGTVFIFLDDFNCIQGTQLEDWVMELIAMLRDCRVVIGRSTHCCLPSKVAASKLPIRNFTQEESREYIEKRLGQGALAAEWDQRVYEYCRGHPLLTAMLAEIIAGYGIRQSDAGLAFLHQSAGSEAEKASQLAQELVATIGKRNPVLAHTLDIACILRNFDQKVLAYVLGSELTEWDSLRELPVVEDQGNILSIHEIFACIRERWLADKRPVFVEEIHRKAAEYYGRSMHQREEESDEGTWERLHYYEREGWQRLIRSWLYHLSAYKESGLEIATRYFDAMFWWGEYIRFPFCELLLADLDRISWPAGSKSKTLLASIKAYHATFVPARERTAGTDPGWVPEALSLLEDIQEHLGLGCLLPDDDNPVRWHLKGLIDNYIGDFCRFMDLRDPEVDRKYRSSIGAFGKAQALYSQLSSNGSLSQSERRLQREKARVEAWYQTWMYIWLSGFYAERGDCAQALDCSRIAEEGIRKIAPDDVEALARVHCVRADAYFGSGDWDRAFVEYCRYALYALEFLIYESGFVPQQFEIHDEYAVEFFQEMVERIAKRLVELQQRDPDVVTEYWSKMYHFWVPEATAILPPELEMRPGRIDQAFRLGRKEQVVWHCLPLPRLPRVYELESLEWPAAAEVRRIQRALHRRHISSETKEADDH